jgi:hypothetical protein
MAPPWPYPVDYEKEYEIETDTEASGRSNNSLLAVKKGEFHAAGSHARI